MMLLREGFDLSMVDVFVADEEEAAKYRKVLGPEISIVVGVPGIHRQRQFVQRFYPRDVWVLSCDDDIRAVKSIFVDKSYKLSDAIPDILRISEREECNLVGFYPNDNGLCLQDRLVIGHKYIIGSVYLFKNCHREFVYPDANTEDFTRSILTYLADGKVGRFEMFGIQSAYFKEPGGLQTYRTPENQEAEMLRLVESYPELVKLRRREGKMVDVQFRRKPQKVIWSPFRDD